MVWSSMTWMIWGTPMTWETQINAMRKASNIRSVWRNENLSASSLLEINHTKFRTLCWMYLFDSARPSSHQKHHAITKSSPRSFFVFSASFRALRPSSPPQPWLSSSVFRPRFCSSPAAKASAPATPMLVSSRRSSLKVVLILSDSASA